MNGDYDQILEHYEYKNQKLEFNSDVNEKPIKYFYEKDKIDQPFKNINFGSKKQDKMGLYCLRTHTMSEAEAVLCNLDSTVQQNFLQ